MSELASIFDKYASPETGATDRNSIHSYADFYTKLFEPIRDKVSRVLEVGVRAGGGMKAWSDFFPNASIYGVDNGLEAGIWVPDGPNKDRIHVAYADTFKPDTIHKLFAYNHLTSDSELWQEPYDIVIDDGCHNMVAQAATWGMLYPYLGSPAYYIIEDIERIEDAIQLQRHFGGTIEDRRLKRNRHDDILLIFRKN